jgi:hypothetical protein
MTKNFACLNLPFSFFDKLKKLEFVVPFVVILDLFVAIGGNYYGGRSAALSDNYWFVRLRQSADYLASLSLKIGNWNDILHG